MELRINKEFVLDTAKALLVHDSPSGFCFDIMELIKTWANAMGYSFQRTNKESGIITVIGQHDHNIIGLSGHVDTLGAMVKSITNKGTLKFVSIGNLVVPSLDGEYCKIRTRDGRTYTGTFLSTNESAHVYKDSNTLERNPDTMEIRIDELVYSREDVKSLGINAGDYIFIEPKTLITEKDFIKSRFIDDKAGVACIMGLLELFNRQNIVPEFTTKIFISVYEEVGHGAAYIPDDITELLAVDMGCIGDDLNCTEEDVSICAKDSGGPYDYGMVSRLCNLAEGNGLKYAVDVYPNYSSDATAALRGGNNIRGALIGPGVSASHGMERTHYNALENTIKLLYLYLTTR